MKKIIYSLVIMIAAGSLFTSCVENTEPAGIKDLREAKADYLAALSKVREADARYRDAQTAVEQAIAAQEQAKAAQEQAVAKALELANEAQKVQDEVAAEEAKAEIERIKADAEKAAVVAAEALAQAQWELEQSLRAIEAASLTLTEAERKAIADAAFRLNIAQSNYNKAVEKLAKAENELWETEYDHAAGYDKISVRGEFAVPSTDYEALIAIEEAKIALKEAEIATTEALKAEPEAVQAYIDAYKDSIKDMKVAQVAAENARELYKAHDLKEAQFQYAQRWAQFYADSVDALFLPFELYAEAPLVKGTLTKKFASYLQNNAEFYVDNLHIDVVEGPALAVEATQHEGIVECLENAFAELDTIVEALNRDLVVVDDSAKAGIDWKKVAADADSVYTTHRAILEKGYKEFEPYKDSVEVLDSVYTVFQADSTAAEVAAAVADSVKKVVEGKGAAAVELVRGIDEGVKEAAAEVYKAVNDIRSSTYGFWSITPSDSTQFINAVKAYGAAQAEAFGFQDSLPAFKGFDFETGNQVWNPIPYSELSKNGYLLHEFAMIPDWTVTFAEVASTYGGQGKAWYADPTEPTFDAPNSNFQKGYTYVIDRETGKAVFDIKHGGMLSSMSYASDAFVRVLSFMTVHRYDEGGMEKQRWELQRDSALWFRSDIDPDWIADLDEEYFNSLLLNPFEDCKYFFDSLDVVRANPVVAETLEDLYEEMDKLDSLKHEKHLADSTARDTWEKVLAAVEGVDKTKDAYKKIYRSFFGASHSDEVIYEPIKFAWTDETFMKPESCISFSWNAQGYPYVLSNKTINIILDGIEGTDEYTQGTKRAKDSYVFEGTSSSSERKRTDYFWAKFYQWLAEQIGDVNSQKAQLEAINEAADFIKEQAFEYIADWEEANAAAYENYAKLVGVDEDGEPYDEVPVLETSFAGVDGKWHLAGLQGEWANELAGDYPAIKAEWWFQETLMEEQIENTEKFVEKLEKAYVKYYKAENELPDYWRINLADIIAYYNGIIEDCQEEIAASEELIVVYEKALAKIAQGVDPYSVELEAAKVEIETLKAKVEQAKAVLDIAQKEYDDVIAKYGVTEE